MILFAIFGIFLLFSKSQSNLILEDNPVTNWGNWGYWSKCPAGTYATAFQLKVVDDQGPKDDLGLSGICLYCNVLGLPLNQSNWIASARSSSGTWREIFLLDGFMTGYQLRAERALGSAHDDTAADNLRVFAASAHPEKYLNEGDGLYFGRWLEEHHCRPRQAICGLVTQVEETIEGDNTALNNVKFECCDLPNPAEYCYPEDKWELVGICDNTNGRDDLRCSHKLHYGVSSVRTCSQKAYEADVFVKVGFGFSYVAPTLASNFRIRLPVSRATGYKWELESSKLTWSEDSVQESQYFARPGRLYKLYQNVGYCGIYSVRSTGIQMVEYRG